MFTQLRIHYPTCGFVTELVTINNGQYIVRCLVQNEGTTLVTALASAQSVEVAEEQAKSRALMALGVEAMVTQPSQTPVIADTVSMSPIPTPIASTPVIAEIPTPIASTPVIAETPAIPTKPDKKSAKTKTSKLPEIPTVNEVNLTAAFESKSETFPELTTDQVTFADEELTFPDQYDSTEVETPIVETGDETAQKVASVSKNTLIASEVEPEVSPASAVSSATPIDFSDIIARTNVQLKRLGWTNQQGRDYLVQTYGKRSRQLLTDAELLDFLTHLESEASP
jgi:hypothetical protein